MTEIANTSPPSLAPGIYQDIPESFYHSLPYISSTLLKKYRNNPAASRLPFEPTWSTILGSASHAYSLQGKEVYAADFVVMPEFVCPPNRNPKGWKNTNDYKALVEDFEMSNVGKTVLDHEQGTAVVGLDASLWMHPTSRELMKRGANELTVIWDDPGTGLRCKARIDDYPGRGIANDYKTCADVSRFYGQMLNLNYDVQGGHYVNGLVANGEHVDTFAFIAGQTSETYQIITGYLSSEWLAWARDEACRLIGLVKESMELDYWPNFRIPGHIYSLSQIQSHDLLVEWDMPKGRF